MAPEPSQRYCKNEACLCLINYNKEIIADDLGKLLVHVARAFKLDRLVDIASFNVTIRGNRADRIHRTQP